MNKKSKLRKFKAPTSAELLARDIREIRREIRRLEDPVRYVVYAQLFRGRNTRVYLDVSRDTYCLNDWTRATLFKQERIARIIAREYSVQQQRKLHVMPVTIKPSGKRNSGHQ